MTLAEKKQLLSLLLEKQRVKASEHLLSFTLHTKPNFNPSWFHTKYYNKLNDFAHGRIKKLMVFVPPQHGKSEGSTRRLPAFLLGRNPNEKIAIASYSAAKARKFNREIQRVIEDPAYQEIFPEVKLSNGADGYARTFDEFEAVGYEGGIKTVGVGGPLTGEPVDTLIMDDLYKDWASAQSEVIREGIQDWYDSVADTRLHNNSRQLIVFTRWSELDLAGYLLEKEPDQWEVIVYPAIKIDAPSEYDPRLPGEALWPERHSIEKLERARARNPHNFESLYQQNPKPKKGLLFPIDELHFYNPSTVDVENLAEYRFGVVDPADEGGDSLSFPLGYLVGNKIYVPHVTYNTHGTDVNEPECVEKIISNRLHAVSIEGNSAWILFAKSVRNKVQYRFEDCEIRVVKNTTNKHTRILAQSAFIKHHFIFRSDYKDHPEYFRFMQNLTSYLRIQEGAAKNKHDDAPDSCAMMASYFQSTFSHLW